MPLSHKSASRQTQQIELGLLPSLIGTHLRQTESRIIARLSQVLQNFSITPAEYGLLLLVMENDDLSQNQLAAIAGYERSGIASLINHLEASGLLLRKTSLFDRRCNALRLSPAGLRFVQQIGPKITALEHELTAGLSPAEQTQLLEFLSRIAA